MFLVLYQMVDSQQCRNDQTDKYAVVDGGFAAWAVILGVKAYGDRCSCRSSAVSACECQTIRRCCSCIESSSTFCDDTRSSS